MATKSFIHRLESRLSGPLPGMAVQYEMATTTRIAEISRIGRPPDHARVAAVLNLLHWQEGAWRTLLIQRTVNPRDRHSGQISFPGGRFEERDVSLAGVALRETEEEVGVPAGNIRILGSLTELYIPVSNYLVHPFVGFLEDLVDFQAEPGEVDAIYTPALDALMDPARRKEMDMPIGQGITLKGVPYFDLEGKVLWGATAMILNEFFSVWRSL